MRSEKTQPQKRKREHSRPETTAQPWSRQCSDNQDVRRKRRVRVWGGGGRGRRSCRTWRTTNGGSTVQSMGSLDLQMEHKREPLVEIHLDRHCRCTGFLHEHGDGTNSLPVSDESSTQM